MTFRYIISAIVFTFGGIFISTILMDKIPNIKGNLIKSILMSIL